MKKIDLVELELINGGDFANGFCAGAGLGFAVIGFANSWNPVGWIGLGVAATCFLL